MHDFSRTSRPKTEDRIPSFREYTQLQQLAGGRQLIGNGSATIVSPNGHLITAAHVVPKSAKALVLFRKRLFEAKVLSRLEEQDALLLQIKSQKEKFPFAEIIECDYPLGRSVFSLGFPVPDSLGLRPRFAAAYISSEEGYHGDESRFTILTDMAAGTSGSGVFDSDGKVIGIVSASLLAMGRGADQFPDNTCFCVKSQSFLDDLSKHLPQVKAIKRQKRDWQEIINSSASASVLVLACSAKHGSGQQSKV